MRTRTDPSSFNSSLTLFSHIGANVRSRELVSTRAHLDERHGVRDRELRAGAEFGGQRQREQLDPARWALRIWSLLENNLILFRIRQWSRPVWGACRP
mgnify:CR=1 FL=1